MKLLNGKLKGATRIKDSQGMSRALSKVISENNHYRLFLPLVRDEETNESDIVIAAVPGRKLNYKMINRGFVTITEFEQPEGSDRIIDKSGLATYSRISKVIHEAMKRKELADAESEAVKTANSLGRDVDRIALSKALDEIKLRYDGDRDAKPNAIYAEITPMISGVVIEIATEVLVVPMTTKNEPEWNKAQLASLPLSGVKASQLTSATSNPDYNYGGRDFLEIDYDYKGKDKNEAGRNSAFGGVSADTSIETKFPELWAANASVLSRLTRDPEVIASRNMSMSSSTSPKEVIELFKKYVSKHAGLLAHLDYESETVKYAAKDMVELQLVADAPVVQKRLLEIVEEQEATRAERENGTDDNDADTSASADVMKAAEAKTIKSLQETVGDVDAITGDESESNVPDDMSGIDDL